MFLASNHISMLNTFELYKKYQCVNWYFRAGKDSKNALFLEFNRGVVLIFDKTL
jgi:hypothetical protein